MVIFSRFKSFNWLGWWIGLKKFILRWVGVLIFNYFLYYCEVMVYCLNTKEKNTKAQLKKFSAIKQRYHAKLCIRKWKIYWPLPFLRIALNQETGIYHRRHSISLSIDSFVFTIIENVGEPNNDMAKMSAENKGQKTKKKMSKSELETPYAPLCTGLNRKICNRNCV